ncbi:MAG: cadherin-like domain-containing protein, partial [Deltaproteobacteria bacterium]|nr:cadherin-like domain-containing protein [Deltaproteobacteria bacterium]
MKTYKIFSKITLLVVLSVCFISSYNIFAASNPTVTDAITDEDTQTSSGLVITETDGVTTTHFKISNIQNGTLYQIDGTTPITAGNYITKAQGNAGLRFTPTLNFNGSGSFDVQASEDDIGTGLSGSVSATVTVNAVNDAPVITEGDTVPVPMDEDGTPTAFDLTLHASDADGDTINWSISGAAGHGTASVSGSPTGTSQVISYTPTSNYNGSDSFIV